MKQLLLLSFALVLLNSCNNKGTIEKGDCTLFSENDSCVCKYTQISYSDSIIKVRQVRNTVTNRPIYYDSSIVVSAGAAQTEEWFYKRDYFSQDSLVKYVSDDTRYTYPLMRTDKEFKLEKEQWVLKSKSQMTFNPTTEEQKETTIFYNRLSEKDSVVSYNQNKNSYMYTYIKLGDKYAPFLLFESQPNKDSTAFSQSEIWGYYMPLNSEDDYGAWSDSVPYKKESYYYGTQEGTVHFSLWVELHPSVNQVLWKVDSIRKICQPFVDKVMVDSALSKRFYSCILDENKIPCYEVYNDSISVGAAHQLENGYTCEGKEGFAQIKISYIDIGED